MRISVRFVRSAVLVGAVLVGSCTDKSPEPVETARDASPPDGDSAAATGGSDAGTAASDAGTRSPDGGTGSSDGGAAGTDSESGTETTGGIFEQPEPWTLDVSAVAKATQSDAIIAALDSLGGWGNGNVLQIDFSIILLSGDASTPRQTITAEPGATYCYGGPDCDPVPLQMPIPTDGNTEGSTSYVCDTSYNTSGQGDCHVLVVADDEKKLYELYNATQSGTAFTALGAFVWDLTEAYPDNLRGDQCTSADAAGFPIAALLPTADEVATGSVNHALRFILPNDHMKALAYVHPASHAGQPTSTNADAPPYGVRLRLNAAFDETPYNAAEQVILHAMKTFGMLLSDGGNIALTFGDDRLNTAKWAAQGITSQSFGSIAVDDFEVVDLTSEITLTDDCVRNP
jgi:hypothetical protein